MSKGALDKAQALESLSRRLFDFIPDDCWMTEARLANALGVSTRQIKNAKRRLASAGEILITPEKNGRRPNPVHRMIKISGIQITDNSVTSSYPAINWELFDYLSPRDFCNFSIAEQLDIYHEMNIPFIPLHFPKFDRKGDPYCSCPNGRYCSNIGKHPAVTFKEIDFTKPSAFQQMKKQWSERDNRFNIGLLTNNFAVLDVDRRHGGNYSFEFLEECYGELPRNLLVETGNGFHLYVSDILSSTVNLFGLSGIDVRSRGGYIIAPFSQHHSGKPYLWRTLSTPGLLSKKLLTDLSKNKIHSIHPKTKPDQGIALSMDTIVMKGARNDFLFRRAAAEKGRGKDHDEILILTSSSNEKICSPPLSQQEVQSIVTSVCGRYVSNSEKDMGLLP